MLDDKRDAALVKLQGTKTAGSVLLDQIVTIDYNARNFEFI